MKKKEQQIIILLTGEQWLGILILTILIVGTLAAVKHWQPKQQAATSWVNDSTKNNFTKYQHNQDSLRKVQWKKQYPRDTIAIKMQIFDPNTVDSTTLLQLGLKRWEARTLIKYRNTGAKFRKKEDIKKLYFVNDSLYQALQPYIHITPDTTHLDTIFHKDTLHHYQRIKKDTILNLRTADTTELKMIPEIGSYRAQQIVLWRQQLGGFTRVEQILEARGMENVNADSLLKHFMIDSIQVDKIPINTASVKRLERHPYLRYEQAKAIYEYRRRHIRINSVDDLKKIKGIAEEDIKKIVPYLDFSHTKTLKTE